MLQALTNQHPINTQSTPNQHPINESERTMNTTSHYFTTDRRDDGTTFTLLTDDAPIWLADAIYEAHDGELPNDWRYAIAARIVDLLDEAQADGIDWGDDLITQVADDLVEWRTSRLFQWVADDPLRLGYVDDAPLFGEGDVASRVRTGQFNAIEMMTRTLVAAFNDAQMDGLA